MTTSFHAGPNALPMEGAEAASRRFYFTIAPRALLSSLREEGVSPARWEAEALAIEIGEAGTTPSRFSARARTAGVLTLASTRCIVARVIQDMQASGQLNRREDVKAHFLKEGHTSSVWRLSSRSLPEPIALNIARDREASEELLASARLLQHWHSIAPRHVVRIDRIFEVIDKGNPVAATAGPWLDTQELHAAPNANGETRFACIDHFEFDSHETGPRPIGRWLSPNRSDHCFATLIRLTNQLTRIEGLTVAVPRFRTHEGDLVWDGEHAVVIAADKAAERMPRERWREEVLAAARGKPSWFGRAYAWADPDRGRALIAELDNAFADVPGP